MGPGKQIRIKGKDFFPLFMEHVNRTSLDVLILNVKAFVEKKKSNKTRNLENLEK